MVVGDKDLTGDFHPSQLATEGPKRSSTK